MYSNRVETRLQYDVGLRQFMLSVFNNMAIGLAISAVVSFLIGTNPELLRLFFAGPQKWIFILAPLGMVFYLSYSVNSMTPSTARTWFFAYAAVMGISLSTIFAVYKIGSIASVFFASSAMFGAMGIYGATTKKDLTGLGSFFMMGVIGILIAALINLFIQSSLLTTGISIISVLLFAGLTAYDVQMLQNMYDGLDYEDRERAGVIGALSLYLDFINIFLSLLRLFGEKD